MAWAGTRGNKRDDVELQFQNINYTICALKLANKIGCKTFIGTGSQAEYGEVEEKLSSNTPANPQTAYGIAKLCAGQISRIMANQIGMNHIWTRILSCYGPYDNEDTMIMQTISEMLKYHHSPEYTKAEQLWDYIYVEDVAKALYLVGKNGKNNSIYCIGSGENYEFLKKINEKYCFFDKIIPLEHPRFIMQYNSKNKEYYLNKYLSALTKNAKETKSYGRKK